MNVVRSCYSGANGIWLLASNFENTLASLRRARRWSVMGRMCCSSLTALLSHVKSTQMRTPPFGFGTTTILAHQSVGSDTWQMMPESSMRRRRVSMTLGFMSRATHRGVDCEHGERHRNDALCVDDQRDQGLRTGQETQQQQESESLKLSHQR
eukprot:scpid55940/ scgid31634/ 